MKSCSATPTSTLKTKNFGLSFTPMENRINSGNYYLRDRGIFDSDFEPRLSTVCEERERRQHQTVL